MTRTINLARVPAPPASAWEYRERAIEVCSDMPGLREELSNLPIGWFPLVERAVEEIRRLLPDGMHLRTIQLKDKFGTLRWYGHVVDTGEDDVDIDDRAAGATDWPEEASCDVCAVFGTADGEIDKTSGWLMTLSPCARRMRREGLSCMPRVDLGGLMYPPWREDGRSRRSNCDRVCAFGSSAGDGLMTMALGPSFTCPASNRHARVVLVLMINAPTCRQSISRKAIWCSRFLQNFTPGSCLRRDFAVRVTGLWVAAEKVGQRNTRLAVFRFIPPLLRFRVSLLAS